MAEPLVVVTRPSQQAGKLAQMVAGIGREVVLLPLLEISALPDQRALQAVLADVSGYTLVAFVSPNAIDAAFAHIAAWPPGVAAAVLGEGSRAALAQHGVHEGNATILTPRDKSRSDSENLLASLDLAQLAGKRVLIVRGESGRELMADGLRAAGALVTTVSAYRRSTPVMTDALAQTLSRLLEGDNDWIITSSEALRGLLALLGEMDAEKTAVVKMQQQRLIVPHARIGDTARGLGLSRLTYSGSGDERLLAALQSRA